MEAQILKIIKDESEKAGVRKHTCVNGWGYSQFERNIAKRVMKLLTKTTMKAKLSIKERDFLVSLLYQQISNLTRSPHYLGIGVDLNFIKTIKRKLWQDSITDYGCHIGGVSIKTPQGLGFPHSCDMPPEIRDRLFAIGEHVIHFFDGAVLRIDSKIKKMESVMESGRGKEYYDATEVSTGNHRQPKFDEICAASEDEIKTALTQAAERGVSRFLIGQYVVYKDWDTVLRIESELLSDNDGDLYYKCRTLSGGATMHAYTNRIRHATEDEIRIQLIQAAKLRGYKPGVIVRCLFHKTQLMLEPIAKGILDKLPAKPVTLTTLEYHPKTDRLICRWTGTICTAIIYKDGQWAEIVKQS
jgi:hypothetical protein